MGKPAAIPLFGDAYLADTTHLTTEEHGAYLLLMIAAWRQEDCSLPLNDKKLARITGLSTRKWLVVKDTILEFWRIRDGRIYQPRLTKEFTYVSQKSDTNRKSAQARWDSQGTENKQPDQCERISERNAPPPPPPPTSDSVAKATAANDLIDPEKILFDTGVTFLTTNGSTDAKARQMLGKWKQEHGSPTTLIALSAAMRAGATDPVPYITACLKRITNDAQRPSIESERAKIRDPILRNVFDRLAAQMAPSIGN